MAQPLFSVVIPTFNRARRVVAAVRSVLAQTEPAWECLVVDDGSSDDTKQRLLKLPDPRLKLVFNERNRGQHACRNQAIRMAQAPWICFLDSDDLYLPPRLAALRRAIEAKPTAGFWFTNAYLYRFGRVIGTLFPMDKVIPEGRVPGWYALGDEHLPYVTTMVAIRREAFEKTGYFREDLRILEDTELYARMLAGGLEVAALKEPLAVRVLHESQITRDHEKDFEEAMIALQASGAPPDVAARIRAKAARQVAEYLWRDLQPDRAQALLDRELPGRRPWKLMLPAWLLRPVKALRAAWLWVRHHHAFAGPDARLAAEFTRELLHG